MPDAPANQAPLFIADDLALDFINAAYGEGEARRDVFDTDEAVLAWLRRAGVAGDAEPTPLRGLKAAAVAFRDHARVLVEQRLAGGWADPAALNRILALGKAYRELDWTPGSAPTLHRVQPRDHVASLLVPVAEALAALLVQPDMSRIRQCSGEACTLLFHDHSRGGRRRWCDMAMCGNRAKVGLHRSRGKGRAGAPA